MPDSDKIAVVIVNYRTPELVTECLASLKDMAQSPGLSVFIGDADPGVALVGKCHRIVTIQPVEILRDISARGPDRRDTCKQGRILDRVVVHGPEIVGERIAPALQPIDAGKKLSQGNL